MSITDNSMYGDLIVNNPVGNLIGGMLVFFVIFFIIMIALSIFMIICLYKIFSKNGKPGWYSIIPFLNTWTLFEIAGNKGWLSLIPFANIVFLFISNYKLAIKMGKSSGIAILVTLVPIIGYPILAFSKDSNVRGNNIETNNQTNLYNVKPQNVEQPVMQNQTSTFIQNEPVVQTPTIVQNEPVVPTPTFVQNEPVVQTPTFIEPEPPVQNINTVQSVNTNIQTPEFTEFSSMDTNMVSPINTIGTPLSEVNTNTNTTNDVNQANNNNIY